MICGLAKQLKGHGIWLNGIATNIWISLKQINIQHDVTISMPTYLYRTDYPLVDRDLKTSRCRDRRIKPSRCQWKRPVPCIRASLRISVTNRTNGTLNMSAFHARCHKYGRRVQFSRAKMTICL